MTEDPHRSRRLPVLFNGLQGDSPQLAARPIAALLAVGLVVLLALRAALSAFPDDGTSPPTFRSAIVDLERAAEPLTPPAQAAAGAAVQVLIEHARATLRALDAAPAPFVDPAISRDLVFVEDAMRALGQELGRAGGSGIKTAALAVETLSRAASSRLERVDAAIAEQQAEFAGTIVRVEDEGSHWQVWRVDRQLHDLSRAAGVLLLLAGSLSLALRLLDPSRSPSAPGRTPQTTLLGTGALAIFLIGSIALVARPTLVAGHAAPTATLVRPGPCANLQVARQVFWSAQDLGVDAFKDIVRARIDARARDCLDLTPEIATAAVDGRFLARSEDASLAPPPAPAVAPVSISLMPAIQEDVTALRSSVATLLEEVASLRAERRTAAALPALDSGTGGPEFDAPPSDPAATSERSTPSSGVVADPEEREGANEASAAPASQVTPEATASPPAPRPFVTTTAVNYRSGPSARATRLGTLQQGTRVRLISDDDGWASVRLHDGRAVYVASAFLRAVE